MGTKRSVLVDKKGIPLSIVLNGANRHDVKLLPSTLGSFAVERPKPTPEHPQNLCMDAAYSGSEQIAQAMGYIVHIRSRRQEDQEKQTNPAFRSRRWVVEAAHSFLNRFRKLLVRFEKKAANYLALLHFACAVIVWRKCLPVHL